MCMLYADGRCIVLHVQAKMLEEMDEEFGVGSLVTETLQEEKQQVCVVFL